MATSHRAVECLRSHEGEISNLDIHIFRFKKVTSSEYLLLDLT